MADNAIKFELLIQNKLFNDNSDEFRSLASTRNHKLDITRCLLISLCEKVQCKVKDEDIHNKAEKLQDDLLKEIISQSNHVNIINDCIDFLDEIKFS